MIIGLRGLGVEIAKNIILVGPNHISIFDPEIVKINDLGTNFYISTDDIKIGKEEMKLVYKNCPN